MAFSSRSLHSPRWRIRTKASAQTSLFLLRSSRCMRAISPALCPHPGSPSRLPWMRNDHWAGISGRSLLFPSIPLRFSAHQHMTQTTCTPTSPQFSPPRGHTIYLPICFEKTATTLSPSMEHKTVLGFLSLAGRFLLHQLEITKKTMSLPRGRFTPGIRTISASTP